ncbi:MAG: SDR family oxidoreductase [Dehalococcoidales bacterium]|nr:SDR family oxidoreductase [Dehalococcoidales bacterium]
MEQKLKGKVALVTGAGRGIGRAYALRLANLGADVAINDIDLHSWKQFDEKLTADTVVDEVKNLGRRSIGIECNVADKKEVDAMFQKILKELGHIDILINNAGGLQVRPETSYASTVPEDDLRREMDRNLMSCIFCCQAASIPMKAQKSGRIVNISSQAGLKGAPDGFYSSYGVAKAGIIAYTRYLAGELAHFGINVNCIAPAFIGTARLMQRSFSAEPGRYEALLKTIPLGRVGTPEDCAKVIEFLVTDLSDYIVGQCISVCGGVILF